MINFSVAEVSNGFTENVLVRSIFGPQKLSLSLAYCALVSNLRPLESSISESRYDFQLIATHLNKVNFVISLLVRVDSFSTCDNCKTKYKVRYP